MEVSGILKNRFFYARCFDKRTPDEHDVRFYSIISAPQSKLVAGGTPWPPRLFDALQGDFANRRIGNTGDEGTSTSFDQPEYIAQRAAGIELIFTDYAHQEQERLKWLQDRYRVVDGEENCS